MDIDARIAQANGRLKSARVGISIEQKGNRLYLRGTLPPRPGSTQKQAYQQRLSLGIHANPSGVKLAEAEARKVGALLDCKQFDWQPYTKIATVAPQKVSEWIEQFEINYFQNRERNDKTLTTWNGDYAKVLDKLPKDELLTSVLIDEYIRNIEPDTKTRKRVCMVLRALSQFAELDYDPSPLAGKYSPKRVTPRDLPDDRSIAEIGLNIKNAAWRWVYGMMATYGLRNHEVFRLDLDLLQQGCKVVSILENTKTGSRRVWACYPEWFEQFDLSNVQLPNVDLNRANERVGRSVTKYFRNIGIPFSPYNLRHCWAVRTIEFGLPSELAAQQMGHSYQVHSEIYHHWVKDEVHQRAYETLMLRSDRPKAPKI
jgi:integrase